MATYKCPTRVPCRTSPGHPWITQTFHLWKSSALSCRIEFLRGWNAMNNALTVFGRFKHSATRCEELKIFFSAQNEWTMRLVEMASGMLSQKGDLRRKTTLLFPPIDDFTRHPNLSGLRNNLCSFGCLKRQFRTLTRHDAIARGKTARMRHSLKRITHVVWIENALNKGCQLSRIFAITWWMRALIVSDSCRGSPNHGS